MSRSRLWTGVPVLLLVASLGCSSSGDNGSDPSTPDPGGNPSISLTLGSTTITITQGQSGQVTITVGRAGGFAGAINVAASGLPQGVSASPVTIAAGSTTGTMMFDVGGGAAVGSSSVTITASGSGVQDVTQSLGLVVEPLPGGGATSAAFSFCDATGLPAWVAYQDGTGPWMAATAGANNTYEFDLSEDRAGIAFADVNGDVDLTVFYLSRDELVQLGQARCAVPGAPRTLNGSVADLAPGQTAYMSLGGASTTLVGGAGSTFTLEGVSAGPQDLVAGRATFDIGTATFSTDRIIIRRDVDAASGSTLPALNFGSEGFAPTSAQVTIGGLGSDDAAVSGFFTTQRGGLGLFTIGTDVGATQTYSGVPTSEQAAGDLHYLQAVAFNSAGGGSGPLMSRTVVQMFGEVEDRTLTLGPALATPTVTVAGTTPYARLRTQMDLQGQYDNYVVLSFNQSGPGRSVLVGASGGYLAGSGSVDLTVPDFSGVGGFQTSWGLQAGQATDWFVVGTGWSAPGGIIVTPFVDGATMTSASTGGQIIP